jgi:hypothetical protein
MESWWRSGSPSPVADYEDPGWRTALRDVGWFVLPIMHALMWRRSRSEDGLTSLRRIHLSLVDSLLLFFIAYAYIAPWNGGSVGAVPAVLALIGVACLFAIRFLKRKPLVGNTSDGLAANYRVHYFVGVGYATVPALFALAAVLTTQALWLYLVGLPFSLVGFALIAHEGGHRAPATGDP